MANIGFRILPFPKRPSPKLLAELRKIVTAQAIIGEINVPVAIGGLVVNPGDIIVGDEDGLVVLPRDIAPDIIQIAREQAVKETAVLKAIRQGKLDRAWVDRTLRQLGCDF